MPPLLIAAAVAALIYLIPKGNGKQSVPVTLPYGQNTFGVPNPQPVTASTQLRPGPHIPTNTPATSQSGLPNSSAQTQQITTPISPPPLSGNPFYSYSGVLQPSYVPTRVPNVSSQSPCKNCNACGGTLNPSSCGIATQRASAGGCLQPTTSSLITKQTIPLYQAWAANVASNPSATPFNTFEDFQNTLQNESPYGEDNSPAVASVQQTIGNSANLPSPPFRLQ
jgi:hypothetical protein